MTAFCLYLQFPLPASFGIRASLISLREVKLRNMLHILSERCEMYPGTLPCLHFNFLSDTFSILIQTVPFLLAV